MPIWGLTCGYFRDLWTEKSKLASMLVFWSPRGDRVPMAWGGCVGTAGYPMGCHWCDLRRPQKIPKPNRFAYPFRSSRGVSIPSILSPCTHTGNSNRYDSDWGTIGKKLGRNYASIYTVFRSDSLFGSKSRGVKPRGPSRVSRLAAGAADARLLRPAPTLTSE